MCTTPATPPTGPKPSARSPNGTAAATGGLVAVNAALVIDPATGAPGAWNQVILRTNRGCRLMWKNETEDPVRETIKHVTTLLLVFW